MGSKKVKVQEALTPGRSPDELAINGRLLRAAVEQIKRNLHTFDPLSKSIDGELFTASGLRGLSLPKTLSTARLQHLFPTSKAEQGGYVSYQRDDADRLVGCNCPCCAFIRPRQRSRSRPGEGLAQDHAEAGPSRGRVKAPCVNCAFRVVTQLRPPNKGRLMRILAPAFSAREPRARLRLPHARTTREFSGGTTRPPRLGRKQWVHTGRAPKATVRRLIR